PPVGVDPAFFWKMGLLSSGGVSPPAQPYQNQTGNGRADADHPKNVVGRRQRALHGPAHPGRARRKQQTFKYEQNSHTDEEVGERYGPHRMGTSLVTVVFTSK